MIDTAIKAGQGLLNNIMSAASQSGTPSLIELARDSFVRPSTLVESKLTYEDITTELMQTANSTFAAIYLASAAIMANENNVHIKRTLRQLNPNSKSKPIGEFVDQVGDMESMKHGLPWFDMESDDDWRGTKAGKDISKDITTSTNLGVGRVLEVQFGKSSPINVAIQLAVKLLPTDIAVDVWTAGQEVKSATGRFHMWRSGEITGKELVLCTDIAERHRKTLAKDTTGTYRGNMNRRSANLLTALATGDLNYAQASAIHIMTTETARDVAGKFGGRPSDFMVREKFFDNSLGMIWMIVDTRKERVEIYTRSFEDGQSLSYREIKSKGSSDSSSNDLIKSFLQSNTSSANF